MKKVSVIFLLIVAGCNNEDRYNNIGNTDSVITSPAVEANQPAKNPDSNSIVTKTKDSSFAKEKDIMPGTSFKIYSNQRFKEVQVKKLGKQKYEIKGKGQIFEASFGWVVEDGHNEIKKGFETTDAGAPDWGNFNFIVEVAKERNHSALHLILFETSAKDGSRQFELPLLLY